MGVLQHNEFQLTAPLLFLPYCALNAPAVREPWSFGVHPEIEYLVGIPI